MRISREAIYQSLYIRGGRGALRQELTACLRSGRAFCMPRERTRSRGKSFIGDAIMISERPAEVEARILIAFTGRGNDRGIDQGSGLDRHSL